MKLLWVESPRIGSWLIRWGLKTDCSHFAIIFDEDDEGGGMVFHSYGSLGAHPEWAGAFFKHNRVVHALKINAEIGLVEEERVYKSVIKDLNGQTYDFKGLLWWAWVGILHRFFNRPLPERNRWQSSRAALCTKLAENVCRALKVDLGIPDFEMIKPHQLYLTMTQHPAFAGDGDYKVKTNQLYGHSG